VQGSQHNAEQLRTALNERLGAIQADNAAKLEEMRRTVDEKLHATLEQRLGESFKLVSDRLEQVHKGLGEMQTLASSVGDLKRVMTNVKSRGTWGEVQLGAIIDNVLTPDQFARRTSRSCRAATSWSSSPFACRARTTSTRCGCPSTPSTRWSNTSGSWTRRTAPTRPPSLSAGNAFEASIKLRGKEDLCQICIAPAHH
jgi:DNA recombination protein RmuC